MGRRDVVRRSIEAGAMDLKTAAADRTVLVRKDMLFGIAPDLILLDDAPPRLLWRRFVGRVG